jgi:hypothetical protein
MGATPANGTSRADLIAELPGSHKSLTELAIRKKRLAYEDRRYKPAPGLTAMYERQAAELLELWRPPDVGPGREVVRPQAAGFPRKRAIIQETLAAGTDRIAEDASIRRTDLLMQSSFNALGMGIDAADSIGAANSLEKMLAHQMAVTHEASLRLMDRALSYEAGGRAMREGDSVEACRLANSSARLMSVFQDGLLTLQRLRTGGNQTVTVQHVNVASGAQAVIGNVQTGGRKRLGRKAKHG